jgi:predicted DNA-binding transcriptional regulator YafY
MLRAIPRYPLKITANELTVKLLDEQFSVSKRTVERDLLELSQSFPLTIDDRNKPYGWSWLREAPSFDLPGLSGHEALMLAMAEEYLKELLPSITNDVLDPHFKAAKRALKEQFNARKISNWLLKVRSISANQPLISPKIPPEIQKVVSEGLLTEKQLNITYQKLGEDENQKYRVHPLAMVNRGNLSYLMVTFFDYKDIRLLAMHRIISAELLNDSATIPIDFDIDKEIAKGRLSFGDGEMIQLVLEFNHEVGEYFLETPISEDQVYSEIDGKIVINVTIPDTPQLRWWILGLGAGVKVIKPSNLKHQLAVEINKMYCNYQE